MQIILVDDEITVLNGLRFIIETNRPEYIVQAAFINSIQALDYIKSNRVDVVITDMKMGELDGLGLIKEIKSVSDEIAIIVLSAYPDFEYVRLAMKMGARDYLLKPCRTENVIELLDKVNMEVKSSNITKANKALINDLIKAFETGDGSAIGGDAYAAVGVIIGASHSSSLTDNDLIRQVIHKSIQDNLIFSFAQNLVILIRKEFYTAASEHAAEISRSLLEYSAKIVFSLVDTDENGGDIIGTYQLALQAAGFAWFNNHRGYISCADYKSRLEQTHGATIMHDGDIDKTVKLILDKDSVPFLSFISGRLDNYLANNPQHNPNRLKNELIEFLVSIEKELERINYTIDRTAEDNQAILKTVNNVSTIAEFTEVYKKLTFSLFSEVNSGNVKPRFIAEAINYINRNYMNDISINEIADAIHINVWYLSTQFKKHVGVSISDYINKTRIRVAKQLLKEPDTKIYQVAEMVGFSDAAYFSTVFKSYEKISPKKYQSSK